MIRSTLLFTLFIVTDSSAFSSPSSNLVRTIRLHLRTISSNKPHPLARESTLSFEIPPHAGVGNLLFNATLQLAYDLVVLFITTATGPTLYGLGALVWNWKTGCIVFVGHMSCLFCSYINFT